MVNVRHKPISARRRVSSMSLTDACPVADATGLIGVGTKTDLTRLLQAFPGWGRNVISSDVRPVVLSRHLDNSAEGYSPRWPLAPFWDGRPEGCFDDRTIRRRVFHLQCDVR